MVLAYLLIEELFLIFGKYIITYIVTCVPFTFCLLDT